MKGDGREEEGRAGESGRDGECILHFLNRGYASAAIAQRFPHSLMNQSRQIRPRSRRQHTRIRPREVIAQAQSDC